MKNRLFIVASFLFSSLVVIAQPKMMVGANDPQGKAVGINAGRVVWTQKANTVTWNQEDKFWFKDDYINQANVTELLSLALLDLTSSSSEKEAWTKLFVDFNKKHGRGKNSYQKGEKIAVKVNMNNTYSHEESEELNASPQLVYALIQSLVNAGVDENDIYIAEPSRFLTDYLFNKCHKDFPKVHFVDHFGGDGREKTEYAENVIPYSVNNGRLATGLSTTFTEATYVMNMALLKGHVGQGVTLCGKNWYGTTNIHHDWRHNAHDNFDQDRKGGYKYMTFVDFMAHKDLGGKTMLYLIDGLLGSKNVAGAPTGKWRMAPFNGDFPNSLLLSQDPVAIDAVASDIFITEFPDAVDVNYMDNYLLEAALAGKAPSGVKYDPERDGKYAKGLGVLEHWNNPTDRQYSRNLSKRGKGIELRYIYKK